MKRKPGRPPLEGGPFIARTFQIKDEQARWLISESMKRQVPINQMIRNLLDGEMMK